MNYIFLDLEWNQPTSFEKLKFKDGLCLNAEIIQIGAVKTDDRCEFIDSFDAKIKPKILKKFNKSVKNLTGITDADLQSAKTLGEVIENFKSWCGTDYLFFTWGYDDINVLGNNLQYFKMDTSWLPEFYNLQIMFCRQNKNENKQYSLSFASQYFSIKVDKPLHNALTDAYITSLIAKKMNIKRGIKDYNVMVFKDKSIPEHMKRIIYKKSYKAIHGYNNIIAKTGIMAPVCPECSFPLKITNKAKKGLFSYIVTGKCAKHGTFAKLLKVYKTADNTFSATEWFYTVDKYNKKYFDEQIAKMRASDRKKYGIISRTIHKIEEKNDE